MANGDRPSSSSPTNPLVTAFVSGAQQWAQTNPDLLRDIAHRLIDVGANWLLDWVEARLAGTGAVASTSSVANIGTASAAPGRPPQPPKR